MEQQAAGVAPLPQAVAVLPDQPPESVLGPQAAHALDRALRAVVLHQAIQLRGGRVVRVHEAQCGAGGEGQISRCDARALRQVRRTEQPLVEPELPLGIAAHPLDPVSERCVLESRQDLEQRMPRAADRLSVAGGEAALSLGHRRQHGRTNLAIADRGVDVVVALEVAQVGGGGVARAVRVELPLHPGLVVIGRDHAGDLRQRRHEPRAVHAELRQGFTQELERVIAGRVPQALRHDALDEGAR